MGGDHGPSVVVPGAALALERQPGRRFLLFGDEAVIGRCSTRIRGSGRRVDRSTTPTSRSAWTTSRARRCATAAGSPRCGAPSRRCKNGEADAAVSAGNTGALMAMARFCLRTMAGSRAAGDRRASGRPCAARASCSTSAPRSAPTPRHLVDMAIMGAAMARIVFDLERPTRRPPQRRRRGDQGRRGGPRGRPHPARGRPAATSTIAASSRATTSARAPSTSSSPKASPATSR